MDLLFGILLTCFSAKYGLAFWQNTNFLHLNRFSPRFDLTKQHRLTIRFSYRYDSDITFKSAEPRSPTSDQNNTEADAVQNEAQQDDNASRDDTEEQAKSTTDETAPEPETEAEENAHEPATTDEPPAESSEPATEADAEPEEAEEAAEEQATLNENESAAPGSCSSALSAAPTDVASTCDVTWDVTLEPTPTELRETPSYESWVDRQISR